jgi:glucose/arabinose dehydrogenase
MDACNRIGNAGFVRHGRVAAFASGVAAAVSLMVTGCPVPNPRPADLTIELDLVAGGFTAPVAVAFPDDGLQRAFVVGQTGTISIIDAAQNVLAEPFLDISARVVELNPGYDERGLLGLAFHPEYAANGQFYVYYIAPPDESVANSPAGVSVLSEFRVSSDRDRADAAGERVLMRFGQPQRNHSGGQLAFGPDGYLYISTGDGGGVGDADEGHSQGGNAQDTSNLLGKILRIDVDGGDPYAIPPDNPFADRDNARPEIWAYGLRNPWRFSIDQAPDGTVRMFAGDVGQSINEEVNLIQRGANYGWRIREGAACFDPGSVLLPPGDCAETGADGAALIAPILEYSHATGTAVIGGAVYRGADVPALAGKYVFGDFSRTPGGSQGLIFCAEQAEDGNWTFQEVAVSGMPGKRLGHYLYGFGQDANGEMYVLTNDVPSPTGSGGRLYRIEAAD